MTETAICTKVVFPSERAAWQRLLEITFEPPRFDGPKPCRVYRCDRCRGWHITRLQGLSHE